MHLIQDIIWKMTLLGFFNWIPDIPYLKWKFRLHVGYTLNLEHPKTFNEKLQWLKLYGFKPEYTMYVDKYAVRDYIASTIGKEYLKPMIAVYDSVKEIDWNSLPEKFALKCTTGSGGNVICTDKRALNKRKACVKLNRAMHRNYFYSNREYPYKNVKPKILCEEFIFTADSPPHDYKIFCFNGKVKLLEFHIDIYGEKTHTCDYYDRDLNRLDFTWDTVPSTVELPDRDLTKKIIELSEKIAKDMCHVRVDWCITNAHIYFGEVTFYNWAGFRKFDSYDDDLLLGSWLKLPVDTDKGLSYHE